MIKRLHDVSVMTTSVELRPRDFFTCAQPICSVESSPCAYIDFFKGVSVFSKLLAVYLGVLSYLVVVSLFVVYFACVFIFYCRDFKVGE